MVQIWKKVDDKSTTGHLLQVNMGLHASCKFTGQKVLNAYMYMIDRTNHISLPKNKIFCKIQRIRYILFQN